LADIFIHAAWIIDGNPKKLSLDKALKSHRIACFRGLKSVLQQIHADAVDNGTVGYDLIVFRLQVNDNAFSGAQGMLSVDFGQALQKLTQGKPFRSQREFIVFSRQQLLLSRYLVNAQVEIWQNSPKQFTLFPLQFRVNKMQNSFNSANSIQNIV